MARHIFVRVLFLTLLSLTLIANAPPVRADAELSFQFSGVRSKPEADFRREIADARERVRGWWGPAYEGPIAVEVTTSQVLSMALVPAWRGERGRMIFGAKRVNEGEAAGIHEMIHVYAPNANRFLAEGLAVYGHEQLGGHAAYPNFGKDLDQVAARAVRKDVLLALERVATPEPLEPVSRDGEAIAGAFVRFLVTQYGFDKFRALYELTPLRVRGRDAGAVERWERVYGKTFAALADDWLAAIEARR